MFVGSCFITLKENPRVYPWIKIFSYGLPTQDHGEGEGRSMSEICYVHGASFTSRRVRKIKTVARRGLLYFVISEMSKMIYNYPPKERWIVVLLFTFDNGDFGAIFVTEWKVRHASFEIGRSYIRLVFILYRIDFCRQEKLPSIVWT